MIHLKIEQTDGEPVIRLSESDLAKLGVSIGDTVSVEAEAIGRGKAFVERYIKTFEALAK